MAKPAQLSAPTPWCTHGWTPNGSPMDVCGKPLPCPDHRPLTICDIDGCRRLIPCSDHPLAETTPDGVRRNAGPYTPAPVSNERAAFEAACKQVGQLKPGRERALFRAGIAHGRKLAEEETEVAEQLHQAKINAITDRITRECMGELAEEDRLKDRIAELERQIAAQVYCGVEVEGGGSDGPEGVACMRRRPCPVEGHEAHRA